MLTIRLALLSAVWAICGTAASAQPVIEIEAMSDDRRRGLSWSDGRAAIGASASLPIGSQFGLFANVSSARGSARHGGADAAIDLSLRYDRALGPLLIDAHVTSRHFPGGAGGLDYVETGGGASWLIGPANVAVFASYAPDQSAIGGDNLYLGAEARVAVIGTPFTVIGGVGRSSGNADDPIRAARLRPAGRYTDWRLGAEYVRGPFSAGIDYVGTDISSIAPASPFADRQNVSDRLLARAAFRF